jgi:two-component system sensor histidine kinase KdpD
VDTAARVIARTFRADVAVLVPDDHERVAVRNEGAAALAVDVGAAQWAYDKAQPAGLGTDTLAGSAFLYLPLRAPMRTRGARHQARESRVLLVPSSNGS